MARRRLAAVLLLAFLVVPLAAVADPDGEGSPDGQAAEHHEFAAHDEPASGNQSAPFQGDDPRAAPKGRPDNGAAPPWLTHKVWRLPEGDPLAAAVTVRAAASNETWVEVGGERMTPEEFRARATPHLVERDEPVEETLQADPDDYAGIIGNDDRYRTFSSPAVPYNSVVKVLIETTRACSGPLVGSYHVLTAGHCVGLGDGTGFFSDFRVLPGMDDGFGAGSYTGRPLWMSQFGSIGWSTVRSYTNWLDNADEDYDLALLTLDRPIGQYVTPMAVSAPADTSSLWGNVMTTAGYPGLLDGGRNQYADSDFECSKTAERFAHSLDTTHGQSGSGIWVNSAGTNLLVGIVATGAGFGNPNYQQPCSNMATRITTAKLNDINAWKAQDAAPADRADLAQAVARIDSFSWNQAGYSSASPTLVKAGGGMTIATSVRNTGTEASGAFSVKTYLSTDSVITGGDRLVSTTSWPSITPFSTIAGSSTSPLSSSVPDGLYYAGFIIDANGNVAEYDEGSYKHSDSVRGFQVRVDSTAPGVSQTLTGPTVGTGGATYSFQVHVTDSGSGIDLIQVKRTSTPRVGSPSTATQCTYSPGWVSSYTATCTYTAPLTTTAIGQNCFSVVARDRLGNSQTTSAVCRSWPV